MRLIYLSLLLASAAGVAAQSATIRGNVYDLTSGEPIAFGTVQLSGPAGLERGANTDVDGFFSFANLPTGAFELVVRYVGYDSLSRSITVERTNEIEYQRILLPSAGVQLATVAVNARKERARSDVAVAKSTVSGRDIRALAATGGEPDIAQYLSVLPGVVSSGDQGGQLYIRGGSPVQNKIIMDGMTIYNPFHSIGLFSVFETEAIRSADVYTGGFNATYGGRVSAIVDIKTREGDKKHFSGLVSASPFQAKILAEGPIKALDAKTGRSISFLLTAKQSLLPQTSPRLYGYAIQDNFFNLEGGTEAADVGLPYDYRDVYGKVSFVGGGGSKFDLFGFNFTDAFDVPAVAGLDWSNSGGGARFKVVPPSSSVVIDGILSGSGYLVELVEAGGAPRSSEIQNYVAQLNFTYFGKGSELRYGFDYNGLNTNFSFVNPVGIRLEQADFTTELNGYTQYKKQIGNLIVEPGLRVQYYASQNAFSLEPRFGVKYNASPTLRFKAAGGLYSQNLISTQNDLDVINFFQGFLVGPEGTLLNADGERTDDNLQRALHGIAGVEVDLSDALTLNLEGYYKGFTQVVELNRNKLLASDPDFMALEGAAYGGDVSVEYRNGRLLLAGNYTLGFVERNDGQQTYPTSFDRRHNVNAYGSCSFGAGNAWQASFRFNFGSPFPFTETVGFIEEPDLDSSPVLPPVLTGNGSLGVLLSPERNGGRLAAIHRLDLSLRRTISTGARSRIELTLAVTNAYNRRNIFYVDRISNERVNQLPFLPSLSGTFYW